MAEIGRQIGPAVLFHGRLRRCSASTGAGPVSCCSASGTFSVDREGCDRRSVKQAVELLTTGKRLVVFPEGEIYHLNDRLAPLLDGVAFMALTAQRKLEKSRPDAARVDGAGRHPLSLPRRRHSANRCRS